MKVGVCLGAVGSRARNSSSTLFVSLTRGVRAVLLKSVCLTTGALVGRWQEGRGALGPSGCELTSVVLAAAFPGCPLVPGSVGGAQLALALEQWPLLEMAGLA